MDFDRSINPPILKMLLSFSHLHDGHHLHLKRLQIPLSVLPLSHSKFHEQVGGSKSQHFATEIGIDPIRCLVTIATVTR